MNIKQWLQATTGLFRTRRKVSALDQRVNFLAGLVEESNRTVAEHRKNLGDIRTQMMEEIGKATAACSRAEILNTKLEAALQAAREEVDTATKITIPGLVAANAVLIDRWTAESEVIAMRQAMAGTAARGVE